MASPGGLAGGQGAAGRRALSEYSAFTQHAVRGWQRLMAERHLGGAAVPWVVIWGAATGMLMALESVYGGGGAAVAGIIFVGALLRAFTQAAG